MESLQLEARLCPAGRPGDAAAVFIVSGPLGQPRALAQAVQLAAQQAEEVLCIAVCHVEEGKGAASAQASTASQALCAAFDSVFLVKPSDSAELVQRLVRALTMPAEPQWIGCDWGQVRYLVTGSRDPCPARYGFGAGRGGDPAAMACAAAMTDIARQGAVLHDARGVCVLIAAAPSVLLGEASMAVLSQLRAAIHPTADIAQSLGRDNTLEHGVVEVSIFVFGTGTPWLTNQ
jgi:hypothetical protein